MGNCAGVDWASEKHDVLIADQAGEDLVGTRTAVTNQLRAELERFWPGPLRLFAHLNSGISLAFLARYPSPADARGLGEARLAAFLDRERYSGRQQPAQLLSKLKSAPEGRVGELELGTRRQLVVSLVATIKSLNVQIKELERQIATMIGEHPDGQVFLSLFKGAVITAAELLAEIGDCRARYPNRDALAADSGQAAVAIESGKRKRRGFAGAATSACAPRSAPWPTAPATATPGPKTSTPRPAPAGTTTPARSGPSGVHGPGSCGAAGKTTPDTTPPDTAPCSSTARSPSPGPRRRAPGPTLLPPSGCSPPPATGQQPPQPEHQALDRNPTAKISPGGLTQNVRFPDRGACTGPGSGLTPRRAIRANQGRCWPRSDY